MAYKILPLEEETNTRVDIGTSLPADRILEELKVPVSAPEYLPCLIQVLSPKLVPGDAESSSFQVYALEVPSRLEKSSEFKSSQHSWRGGNVVSSSNSGICLQEVQSRLVKTSNFLSPQSVLLEVLQQRIHAFDGISSVYTSHTTKTETKKLFVCFSRSKHHMVTIVVAIYEILVVSASFCRKLKFLQPLCMGGVE